MEGESIPSLLHETTEYSNLSCRFSIFSGPPPSAALVSAERAAIVRELATFAQKTIDLKMRLNALTPIGRLPHEILAKILVSAVHDFHYPKAYSYETRRPQWIKLAHVCRRWREVALETSRFWRYLRVTRTEVVSELLARSKNTPLDVDLCLHDHATQTVVVLAQQLHRIHKLRLTAPMKVIQTLLQAANDTGSSLALQDVELSNAEYAGSDRPTPFYGQPLPLPPPLIQSSGLVQQLRHLVLKRLRFAWSDAIFCPSLTSLTVSGRFFRNEYHPTIPNLGTFQQFWSTLEGLAPRLEVLDLEEAVPRHVHSANTDPSLPRPLVFPRLRSLKYTGNMLECSVVFCALQLNPGTIVDVNVWEGTGMQPLIKALATHAGRPRPLRSLSIVQDYSSGLTLRGWRSFDTSATPDWQFHLRGSSTRTNILLTIVKDSYSLFTRLEMVLIKGALFDFSSDRPWASLLRSLHRVRVLDVADHPFDDLYKAFLTLSVIGTGAQARSYVPLPSLRMLTLRDCRFRSPNDFLEVEPFDRLVEWAMLRCHYSIPIDRLHLYACRHVQEEDIDTLEEIIPYVVWDGWERPTSPEPDEYDSSDDSMYGFY